jgi:uncharacterized protein YceK
MKRIAVVFSVGTMALALTGCGTLTGHDCGACCKGVGYAWRGGK